MNKKAGIAALVVVVIVGAGVVLATHKSTDKSSDSSSSTSQNNSSSSNGTMLTSDSMSPSFTINANDNSADHETISVVKGADVSLTFAVDKSGVYHGGLEFKSTDPQIDSGAIAPGASKTVHFTASKSFSFQPYWYASQVKKDYLVTVTVKDM